DSAFELARGRLAAQARERRAGFLRAAIELLHPFVAEPERRREVEAAAVGWRRTGDVRPGEAEDLAHRAGHLVGALSAAHRAEPVLDGVAIERVAVGETQPAADLAGREDALAADERLGQQLEDAGAALDEDLVSEDGGDALLDGSFVEDLAEQLRGPPQHGPRHFVVLATQVGLGEDLFQALGERSQVALLQTAEERAHVGLRGFAEEIVGPAQRLAGGGNLRGAPDVELLLVDAEEP